MYIKVLCVGKLKEKYWSDGVDEYMKRIKSYCRTTVEEIKESKTDDVEEEGKNLLSRIEDGEYVITLEIKGKRLSSEGLSEKIGELMAEGRAKGIVFVIGGSEGLSNDVMKRSDFALSFSDMTFPHQMMRVILLEQIYRSFRILRNEPYHK